jgi:N-methylhydantoinase A/oxoprolinase/acetone carboxylase beta subunit
VNYVSDFSLSIDIGGTFTDIVLLERSSGRIEVNKILTTYPDPSEGVLKGTAELLHQVEVNPERITRVIHGTTLVTNTLIERKGARTGLVTTRGFRDALEIGREGRYDIYDLRLELPEPLVERRHRLEVDERLNPDGGVRRPLDPASIEEACDRLVEAEVDAVGVCLLHAYANPEHEERVRAEILKKVPNCAISISSEVAPELREYERTSTTVANAYVQPMVQRYLSALEVGLQLSGILAPLHIMLSNGGSCSVETATRFPVRLVESGPCGGALAAGEWGRRAGLTHVFAFDMGGTTAKASLSVDGDFPITTESEVARIYRFKRGSGLPLLVPVLDMIEIGAGGGSIAHLNALGLPTVGPESAGATPGPACYGQKGKMPTVTDADLLLGFLNPDYFLGGDMSLNVEHAREAVLTVAEEFGGDVVTAALGIHQLVNENMANAARVHAAERGVDLRQFALVATGGAGPVHACGVAARLGLTRVLIPPMAGVGSAFGLLLAPISFDFARSYVTRFEDLDLARLGLILDEMSAAGAGVVEEAGVESVDIQRSFTADIRYVGQGHEIRVTLPDQNLDEAFGTRLIKAFEYEYTRLFGRICEGVPVEVIHWRVTVSGPTDHPEIATGSDTTLQREVGVRPVVFDRSGPVETQVFSRYGLREGIILGPAIIEEAESTAVVPPGWEAEVRSDGALLLARISQ